MIDRAKIRLAYYESSDGPRVTLIGPLEMNLIALRECFPNLSITESENDLDKQDFIFSHNVCLGLYQQGTCSKQK